VGLVVNRLALGQVSLQVLWSSHQYHSNMALHNHISPGDEQKTLSQFRDPFHQLEQQVKSWMPLKTKKLE
jgi:hypothetical protein